MHGHCLVRLNTSHVFLTGGKYRDSDNSPASYIYSGATGFSRQGDMSVARLSHACALHGDQVWVAGGFHGAVSTSEYFSLATSTWLPGPGLPSPALGARLITVGERLTLIGNDKRYGN